MTTNSILILICTLTGSFSVLCLVSALLLMKRAKTLNEKLEKELARQSEEAQQIEEDTLPIIPTGFFSESLEGYKTAFDKWMLSEKPYLRPSFQLADVAILFPINRTYLSRLFSEGYGKSFSQVVRQYRIEEAKRMMLKHPELPLKHLATLCGFTSQVVFSRTFVEETGMTPKQYKNKIELHTNN